MPKKVLRKPSVKPQTTPVKEARKQFPKEKPCATKNCPNSQQQGKSEIKRFTPKQSEIIKKAKNAKKTGLSENEAKQMVKEAREAGLDARGPEDHPNRPHGKNLHIHVGPVNHIPVK
jgi:hypothetical protein